VTWLPNLDKAKTEVKKPQTRILIAIKELKINALLKPRIMCKAIEKSESNASLPTILSTYQTFLGEARPVFLLTFLQPYE